MMYFCPCSCDDPIDPDTEDNALFSLPRNLSYVQESYLDRYSVSARFVHNPKIERCFQQQEGQEWRANVRDETLGLLSAITTQELQGSCQENFNTSGFLFSHSDTQPRSVSPTASTHSSDTWTEPQQASSFSAASLLHPASFVASKISAFLHSPPNESMDSARDIGTSVDGEFSPPLQADSLTGFDSLVLKCPDSSAEGMDRCDDVTFYTSSHSGESDTDERDASVGQSDSRIEDDRGCSLDVTTSSGQGDNTTGEDAGGCSLDVGTSSGQGDNTTGGDATGCSLDVASSSDNTGGGDAGVCSLDVASSSGIVNKTNVTVSVINDNSNGDTKSISVGTFSPSQPVACSTKRPYGLSAKTHFYKQDSFEEDTEIDDTNRTVNVTQTSEMSWIYPQFNSVDGDINSRFSKEYITENVDKKDSRTTTSSDSSVNYESPDSDAFVEEGVFVNIDDLDSTTEKSTTVSDASDDTCISVDSMFLSPDEGELDEEANEAPVKKMTLEEAISRAASDLTKMSLEMYGSSLTSLATSETNSNISLPDSEYELNCSTLTEKTAGRSSPVRGCGGLKIKLTDPCAGEKHLMTDSCMMLSESPIYPENEFNFSRVQLRKSSSLKSNKTPPGTPHRKKVVRFADAMGLDLESVRHVLNMESPPKIPASALADLMNGLHEENKDIGSKYLCPCFAQPGAGDNFFWKVRNQKVCLENAIINDLTITGFVRVSNIAYNKSVRIRYTHNSWVSFYDIAASYVQNSCDGPTDRFSFSIVAPPYFGPGSRLEFAICYIAEGVEYWDNNEGKNYVFECFAKSIPNDSETAWLHFL